MILVGFFLHLTGLWSVKWNLYGLRNFPGLWCGLESQLCSPACFHCWKGEERKMTLEKKLISIWQVCVCVCFKNSEIDDRNKGRQGKKKEGKKEGRKMEHLNNIEDKLPLTDIEHSPQQQQNTYFSQVHTDKLQDRLSGLSKQNNFKQILKDWNYTKYFFDHNKMKLESITLGKLENSLISRN